MGVQRCHRGGGLEEVVGLLLLIGILEFSVLFSLLKLKFVFIIEVKLNRSLFEQE